MAVSALAGCVTIQQPPAPVQPSAPARPPGPPQPQPVVPPPAPEAQPQIVQAPAREALERVGTPRKSEPTPDATAEAPPALHTPSDRTHPHPHHPAPPPHPQHPQPRAPRHPEQRHHTRPRADVPDVPKAGPKGSDVCSLGKKYGGWRPGSPEASICEQTYGR